ncbi:hypothetical protein quinque_012585 [Culex quinquefasciatus]
MSCYRLVIILATVLCAEVLAISHEVRPERFEQMLGFEYVNTTGIRVRKFNRTTWIFDGQGEAFQDFNDDYMKGLYWVKEFAPGTDWVLPVVPEGYWRFTGDVYDKEGQLIIRLAGYFHLSRNMFE